VRRCCECGNGTNSFIKATLIIDDDGEYQLLKKVSAAWGYNSGLSESSAAVSPDTVSTVLPAADRQVDLIRKYGDWYFSCEVLWV
jgi:hypothetical protein